MDFTTNVIPASFLRDLIFVGLCNYHYILIAFIGTCRVEVDQYINVSIKNIENKQKFGYLNPVGTAIFYSKDFQDLKELMVPIYVKKKSHTLKVIRY